MVEPLLSDEDLAKEKPALLSDADLTSSPQGPLANAPGGDSTESGIAKGTATAAIKGLAHIPGMVGDIRDMSRYVQSRVGLEGLRPRSASFWDLFPSGEDIARPILRRTGEYKPTSTAGRMASTGLETGLSMLGPGGLLKIPRLVSEGYKGLMPLARSVLGSSAKPVAGGAVSGATGQLATEATGDPLAGIAAGVVVPAAGAKGARYASSYLKPVGAPKVTPVPGEPLPESRTADIAAQRFQGAATNPAKVLADARFQPRSYLEGLTDTTGEVTGDPGLLAAQKRARTESPGFNQEMQALEAERNAAKSQILNGIEPPQVDARTPSLAFRSFLQALDQHTQQRIAAAEGTARSGAQGVPRVAPETLGARLRSAIQPLMDAQRDLRARLYQSVDPNGQIPTVTTASREAALKMAQENDPRFTEVSEHVAPVLERMSALGDTTMLKNVMQLDQLITQRLALARRAQDHNGVRQLGELKNVLMDDVGNAVDNYAKHQSEQPQLPENELVAANLQRQLEAWRAARTGRATGTGPTVAEGTEAVPGAGGTRGATEEGQPHAAGDQGLAGDDVAGAEQRLSEAKAQHALYDRVYRKGPVGQGMQKGDFSDQYKTLDSELARGVFPGGDKGGQVTRSWLEAAKGDPEALSAIEDMAASHLVKEMKGDQVLTPEALARWKLKHGPSLTALDEHSPGFSGRFDDAAKATETLRQMGNQRTRLMQGFEDSSAAKLLDAQSPQEVARAMGSIISQGQGAVQGLLAQVERLPMRLRDTVLSGLRRGALDHLEQRFSNYGAVEGGQPVLSGAKMLRFLDQNSEALEPLLGKEGTGALSNLAANAEREAGAGSLQRTKLGSDTAQNTAPWIGAVSKHAPSIGLGGLAMLEGAEALSRGEGWGAAAMTGAAAAGQHILEHLRNAGLRNAQDLYELGLRDPEVGAALMDYAQKMKGRQAQESLNRLLQSVQRSAVLTSERPGHASGGSVIDHEAEARKLISRVAEARQAHGKTTKPILGVPDETVTRALAIANGVP